MFGDDVRPPPPVDRGAVHGPLGVGTAAAMRRAVDRAVTTARVRLKNLNLHLPGRGSDKEDARAKKEDATTVSVSVADILDDLERQLFLASPASAGVAHHESPLSALARAGHGVLDVFPSLGISGMFDTEPPKPLMRSAMDVRELDDAIEFVADVPGARDEDLQVEVLKKDPNAHRAFDVLVVRGERDKSRRRRALRRLLKKQKATRRRDVSRPRAALRRVRKPVRASAERGRRPDPREDLERGPDRACAETPKRGTRRGSGTAGTAEAGGQARRRRRGVTRERRMFLFFSRDVHRLHTGR